MEREEIIRLAAESEVITGIIGRFIFKDFDHLSGFAALVAEKEREECAKVCLEEAPSIDGELCAAAIRARGK